MEAKQELAAEHAYQTRRRCCPISFTSINPARTWFLDHISGFDRPSWWAAEAGGSDQLLCCSREIEIVSIKSLRSGYDETKGIRLPLGHSRREFHFFGVCLCQSDTWS